MALSGGRLRFGRPGNTTLYYEFGTKTNGQCGGVGFFSPGVISGTGSTDWTVRADGKLAPAGTYKNVVSFSRSSYDLTIDGQAVHIDMVTKRANMDWITGTDTQSSNQFKTLFERAQGTSGALVLGDTIMMRDGTLYNPVGTVPDTNPTAPVAGWAGGGTLTAGGSGYVNATYALVPLTGGSGTGAVARCVVSGGAVASVHIQYAGSGYIAGDVLGTSNADLGGSGSGFQYTVIDLAARITVRSETPDVGLDPNYPTDYARGGGAKIAALRITDGSTGPGNIPFTFKYISCYWNNDWVPGETCTLTLSGVSGSFTIGEPITCTSGGVGVVASGSSGTTLKLTGQNTGPILLTSVVTGGTSGATGTVTDLNVEAPIKMIGYRNANGWGMAYDQCRFSNGPAVSAVNRAQWGIELRQASATKNMFQNLARSLFGTGDSTGSTQVTEFAYNVTRKTTGDGLSGLTGYNWDIHHNFFCGFILRRAASHVDTMQYQTGNNGQASPGLGLFRSNISMRGTQSTTNDIDAQGVFIKGAATGGGFAITGAVGTPFTVGETVTCNNAATGKVVSWSGGAGASGTLIVSAPTSGCLTAVSLTGGTSGATGNITSFTPSTYAGITVSNNVTLLTFANQVVASVIISPTIQYNTVAAFYNAPDLSPPFTGKATITTNGLGSSGGTATYNIANAYDFSESSPAPSTTGNKTIASPGDAAYNAYWGNYTALCLTMNDLVTMLTCFSPTSGGSAMNGGDLYSGAMFPPVPGQTVGARNDGSAYDPLNPSWVAAHPPFTSEFLQLPP